MSQSATDAIDRLQQLRVVTFGLMGGLVAFGVLSFVIGPVVKDGDPLVPNVLLGCIGLMCVADAIAYRAMRAHIVRELAGRAPELRAAADPTVLALPSYGRLVIVRGGLAEGPGLVGPVLYLLNGNLVGLAVAAGALLILGLGIPSHAEARALAEEAAAHPGP